MKLTELSGCLALGALLALAPLACGDSDSGTGLDAGPTADANAPDAQIPRALCPAPEYPNPECTSQDDCVAQSEFNMGMFSTVSEPCDDNACPEFSASVCTFGQCELREDLAENDGLIETGALVQVPTGGLFDSIAVLVGIAVQAETAGGAFGECDQVRAGSFNLDSQCTNIVDVRTVPNGGGSETFPVTFNRIPAEREIMFIVYGHANPDASDAPIGVYCTKQMVPEPSAERVEVDSEPGFGFMQPIE